MNDLLRVAVSSRSPKGNCFLTQIYFRLAEISVGQLSWQPGEWCLSDASQIEKPIRTITVTTSFARMLSLTSFALPIQFLGFTFSPISTNWRMASESEGMSGCYSAGRTLQSVGRIYRPNRFVGGPRICVWHRLIGSHENHARHYGPRCSRLTARRTSGRSSTSTSRSRIMRSLLRGLGSKYSSRMRCASLTA